MGRDLTGGIDPSFEYFVADKPAAGDVRDSATIWVMDETGTIALPRVTFDAIASDWGAPWVQINAVHADGRALRVWSREPGTVEPGANGRAAARSAGPLRFRCIEPFRRWSIEFDGTAQESTTVRQLAGEVGGRPTRLAFRLDAEMAAPPWLMGGLTAEAAREMKEGDASILMGGVRYEQLCRLHGSVIIGDETYRIAGTGMRVRRQGVRNMAAAMGHCQHSALFPSGRAFGAIIMAAGPNEPEAFNEAFLFTSDRGQIPARVVQAPWMTRLVDKGDDASLVLESEAGTVRIGGEVLLSTFDQHLFEMADSSVLHQGTARYTWDGEETIGLIERCTLRNRLKDS